MTLQKHWFAALVLLVYTVIGLFIYQDYGISWDEEFQHGYGKTVYEYVFEDNQALHEHHSRYHGPAFQLPLYTAERVLGLEDKHEIYQFRHLITFLTSVIGLLFFYRVLLLLGFSRVWATVGLLFMMCSPRIFVHSFYNSKDIVFMYVFVIGIYTMLQFLRRPNWQSTLWHGLVCGFLIDVRILGLFVPFMTAILWLFKAWNDMPYVKRTVPLAFAAATAMILTMIFFWPTLWHAADLEIRNAISRMSDYPWDNPVLFEGEFMLPKELPWYYLPKWMLITTPIFILILSAIGSVAWFLRSKLSPEEKLIPIIWIFSPWIIIVWKNATVYDSWRHVFFLYPAIIILAIAGTKAVSRLLLPKKYAVIFPLILMAFPTYQIIKMHPHQQVYFNELAGEDVWRNYEMDYWGLSYKQAFAWLVKEHPEEELKVSVTNSPGFYNHWTLPLEERKRINYVEYGFSDYFITNFRYPNELTNFIAGNGAYANPIHIIKVNGNPVVGIFRPE